MAHIGIDARKYFDFGIGTYIQNLIDGLAAAGSPHTFTAFVAPEDTAKIVLPDRWQQHVVRYGKYSVSELALFGYAARRYGVDLFHSPHYTLPFGLKRKSVVTIQDLIHLRFPQYFSPIQRAYAAFVMRHALNDAGAIITTSEFTKRDIMKTFSIPERRLHVIPLCMRKECVPVNDASVIEDFRKRFVIDRPFILYVGSAKPYKNIPLLLRAFRNLGTLAGTFTLAFAGEPISLHPELLSEIQLLGLKDNVVHFGRLSSADLVTAYSMATVLVLPSAYEGFGLPAVEAMACGTPVIVSDAASLPEVVGDAAEIFRSGDVESLGRSLENVLSDSAYRSKMIEKGKINIQRFSWKENARQTLDVYNEVLS